MKVKMSLEPDRIHIYIYINGCFNWMIPNVCLIKDPFKTACLEFQEDDC